MRRIICFPPRLPGATLAAVIFGLGIACEVGAAPTVRVYDENVIQPNVVDFIAVGSSMTASQFAASVALAYDRDQGGVLDGSFVSGTGNSAQFGVTQLRTLSFQVPTNWAVGSSSVNGTPISRTGSWATSFSTDPFNPRVIFELPNVISGGVPGERIAQVGVTVLSSGVQPLGEVSGQATFSGGGGQLAIAQIPLGLAAHDTFFGFIAPQGQWITRLELDAYNGGVAVNVMRFDDLGFVTTAFVPEPLSHLIAGIGLTLQISRRRDAPRG